MRIHLGHHFYGAGNLGDDFMLAGWVAALKALASQAICSSCVPFNLHALVSRFPAIQWRAYENIDRERFIAQCDVWLGLGGSPFQHSLSRWFLDHLISDAALCAQYGKPMFFLGIGVQSRDELASPEIRRICSQAAAIWTRDATSANYLTASLPSAPPIAAASDLAHIFFREQPPPSAKRGRLTLVANFDYGSWPGQRAFLEATASLPAVSERVWLAQESRELPGAERALYAALPADERARWKLVVPDIPGAPLAEVLTRWPSGEWLVTARYHAALAGAWAGSKVVVIAINEKLRAAARELNCPMIEPDAEAAAVIRALEAARPAMPGHAQAERAFAACAAFVQAASSFRK